MTDLFNRDPDRNPDELEKEIGPGHANNLRKDRTDDELDKPREDDNLQKLRPLIVVLVLVILLGLGIILFSQMRSDTEKRSMDISPDWENLGYLGDSFCFTEDTVLMGRALDGSLQFTRDLGSDAVQVAYGSQYIYVLWPKERLACLDSETGEDVISLETDDIEEIAIKDGYLLGLTDREIKFFDKDLEETGLLTLDSKPVSAAISEDGTMAWVEQGQPLDQVKTQGYISIDPVVSFLESEEAESQEYESTEDEGGSEDAESTEEEMASAEEVVSSEEEMASAEEVESVEEEPGQRNQFSIGNKNSLSYRVSTGEQQFHESQWINPDRVVLFTNAYVYFFNKEMMLASVPYGDLIDYGITNNQVAILEENQLRVYDQDGNLSTSYPVDFQAQQVVTYQNNFILLGQNELARVVPQGLSIQNTGEILDAIELSNGEVILVFRDGIQKLSFE